MNVSELTDQDLADAEQIVEKRKARIEAIAAEQVAKTKAEMFVDYPDWKLAGLPDGYERDVHYLAKIQEAKRKIAAQESAVRGRILEAMTQRRVRSTSVSGGLKVTYSMGRQGASKIDGVKLMKLGVALDLIQKATVQGKPGKPYIVLHDSEGGAGGGEDA
jgi:hypothetical protein